MKHIEAQSSAGQLALHFFATVGGLLLTAMLITAMTGTDWLPGTVTDPAAPQHYDCRTPSC